MLLKTPSSADSLIPLVLDLDGTLIKTDTLYILILSLFYKKPWYVPLLPFWFWKSRPFAKARLTELIDLPTHTLPYNFELLDFAKREAKKGRTLILATGTDQRLAQKIADHLGIFHEVIGSDGQINMTGPRKQKALVQRFGAYGFDYAGDAHIDLHVWAVSRRALVVRPKRGVLKRILAIKASDRIHHFPR